jgi:hypothetical protein
MIPVQPPEISVDSEFHRPIIARALQFVNDQLAALEVAREAEVREHR